MIDEDMFEEDKINRFLNMIATQYDGNLANQYASSYLEKCNEIKRLKESIGELTNRNVKASVYIQEHTDKLKTIRVPKIEFDYEYLLNILKGDDTND